MTHDMETAIPAVRFRVLVFKEWKITWKEHTDCKGHGQYAAFYLEVL